MTDTRIVFPTTRINVDSKYPALPSTGWVVAAHYQTYWKVFPYLWPTQDGARDQAKNLPSCWHHRQIFEIKLEPNP